MIKLAHIGLALLALSIVEIASAHDSKAPAAATQNAAGGFGAAMPADAKPVALADAMAKLDATTPTHDGVFAGRVGKVCQKQGCWMQLLDGEQSARVMTGHKFTLPKDFSGNVVVNGKLERTELSEKEARHMASDAGKEFDPSLSRVEYRIDARGVAHTD